MARLIATLITRTQTLVATFAGYVASSGSDACDGATLDFSCAENGAHLATTM